MAYTDPASPFTTSGTEGEGGDRMHLVLVITKVRILTPSHIYR